MVKRRSKYEALDQIIEEAFATMIVPDGEAQNNASEPYDAEAFRTARLKRIDVELANIRNRYDLRRTSIERFRDDGASAILLLTERYVVENGVWLVPAHAIAVALQDLDDEEKPKSPLLGRKSEMDSHVSLWASYYEPQIRPNVVAAGLMLRKYCEHSAEEAAIAVARVLNRTGYRSSRGTRASPKGEAIEKWMRDALNAARDRDQTVSELQSYLTALNVVQHEKPQIGSAEVEELLASSLEEMILFKAHR